MIARVREFIRENQMIQPKDKIIVGISGGPDSVCLLFVLLELKKELDFELIGVHVNHGLRGGEAGRDEAFVRKLCAEQGVPLLCHTCNVREEAEQKKLTLEEAGRACRYRIFEQEAEACGCTRIAVAHHAGDQAETMLFHLFRGTGIRGLKGMEPIRGKLIRPLLCAERKEILDWLSQREIPWCTDSTNQEETYTRNRIRHTILACAEEQINAQAVRHMAETAGELRQVEAYLEEETKKAFRLCVRTEENGCFLFTEAFRKLNPVIGSRVLRRCLEELGGSLKDVERTHIRMLTELLDKQTGSRLDLPGGCQAFREYQGLYICRETAKAGNPLKEEEAQAVRPSIPGACRIGGQIWEFSLENAEKSQIIPEKTYTKWFDCDKIKQCLEIRGRRPGDYLEINREHGRKKLKDYLIDQKIPVRERDRLKVLADGNHVLWVPGKRISEGYKVTENTRKILKVQIVGGNEDG